MSTNAEWKPRLSGPTATRPACVTPLRRRQGWREPPPASLLTSTSAGVLQIQADVFDTEAKGLPCEADN